MPLKTGFKKVLYILSAVIIIGLITVFSVSCFFEKKLSDSTYLKNLLSEKYDLILDCDEFNFNIKGLSFYISSPFIQIKGKDTPCPFLTAKDLNLGIKILPLIFKRLAFQELSAEKLELNASRKANGSYDFAKYIKTSDKKISTDFSKAKVSIPFYTLNFNDEFIKNNYILSGNSLKAFGLDINKKFILSTSGTITTKNAKGIHNSNYFFDIDITGFNKKRTVKKQEILLSGFDTSFLSLYLKKYGVTKFDSTIDIYSCADKKGGYKVSFYIDNLNAAFNYKDEKNTMKSSSPLIFEADMDFIGSDFIIKNANFLSENINIDIKGKIKNGLTFKNISPELDIKFNNTQLRDLVLLAPDTLFPMQEPYVQTLKQYNAHAVVNGGGKIIFKNSEDFKINGELDFTDVYLVERPKNAKTSFGKVTFKEKDVIIQVYANAPNNAALTLYGKTKTEKLPVGEFAMKSKGKLDMEFAQSILNPLQKILALKLGPLPYMKLKGSGELQLYTKGTKIKSKAYGWFTTNNAAASLEGLNATLTNGKVKIVFDGDNISYNGATGLINGAKSYIDGHSDTSGNMTINVKVNDIPAQTAINIAKTSYLVTNSLDGGKFLNSFKPKKGNLDFQLNLSGNVPPDAVFGEQSDSVAAKGKITFKGVDLTVQPNIKAQNLKGVLNFSNATDFDLTADIHNSPFKISGKVYQKGAKNKVLHGVPSTLKINFTSDKVSSKSLGGFIIDNIELFNPINRLFALNLAKIFNTNNFTAQGTIEAQGLVNPESDVVDLSGFDFKGKVSGVNQKDSDCAFKQGNITLLGKDAKFNNLRLILSGVDFLINGSINKFASIKPHNDLKIVFYNSKFKSYTDLFKKAAPDKIKSSLDNIANLTGNIEGEIKLKGDKIAGGFTPHNITFTDKKGENKLILKSGKVKLKNEKTYIQAFNLLYDNLPVYFDGYIQTDGEINPEFNLFVSTNLTENTCDKLINPYMQYPVSITGEAALKGRIAGRLNQYTSYLTMTLNEGSDFSFMGLKLGDVNNKRELISKIKFKGSYAHIDYINYAKYVLSQNNKQSAYDLIKITGGVKIQNGDYIFNNLKVITPNPAPVRFLNLVFKKSLIKDGQFTSNIILNGSTKNINATGKLNFSNVFIPMYNSIIENIDITLNKQTGTAKFSLFAFDTKGDFIIDFMNKTELPFVINDISIHSESVISDNLIKLFSTLSKEFEKSNNLTPQLSQSQITLKPSDILIKKGSITANKILFNNVVGQNLKINFSHSKDCILKIDTLYLAIADGLIKGTGLYNFDSSDISAESIFIDCDINELTKAFFNLQGQIFGNANGKFTLSMKNFNPNDYMNKINADGEFTILKGKMPKLGSIEYLLRTSNLFKSGIFGLTINNVLQLLTPYKQGDFEKIAGTFKVKGSIVQDLKIYSQGENLSTYINGSYDIISGNADIEILGKLSKKVSNLLGPIGNASVVSILNAITRDKIDELMKNEMVNKINKIPLINLDNDEYRLFSVKLKGEISTEDVVKSFNWLN